MSAILHHSHSHHHRIHLTPSQFHLACLSYLHRSSPSSSSSPPTFHHQPHNDDPLLLHTDFYVRGWKWIQHPILPQLSHMTRVLHLLPRRRRHRPPQAHQPLSSSYHFHPFSSVEEKEEVDLLEQLDATVYRPCSRNVQRETETVAEAEAEAETDDYTEFTITCTQEIFYSSTWRVPLLYLHAQYTHTGQSLDVAEIMNPDMGIFLRGGSGERMSSTLQPLLDGLSLSSLDEQHQQQQQRRPSSPPPPSSSSMAYFPPVTLMDHPITSMPCLALHPCQTAALIQEMLTADDDDNLRGEADEQTCRRVQRQRQAQGLAQADGTVVADGHRDGNRDGENPEIFGRKYIEAFMTICASAVEMRG